MQLLDPPSCAGVRIIDPPQLTVGQSATLTCESDVAGTIEWLDSGMSVLATVNGTELNYTIDTVSDGMHGSILTCRAPGGSEVISLTVNGELVLTCVFLSVCLLYIN